MQPLPRAFFREPTVTVARRLLGKWLVRRVDDGPPEGLRIVETEAYCQDDPASHAFRGKTAANAAMFGRAGTAYVYRSYGIHFCLNAVCQDEGVGEAALIRAIDPGTPWEFLATQMPAAEVRAYRDDLRREYAGPGRLTRTLEIDRERHDGIDLCNPTSALWLADGEPIPEDDVKVTTRIGISKAAEFPWRFYVMSSPLVSRR